jgi:hypothetical protein
VAFKSTGDRAAPGSPPSTVGAAAARALDVRSPAASPQPTSTTINNVDHPTVRAHSPVFRIIHSWFERPRAELD